MHSDEAPVQRRCGCEPGSIQCLSIWLPKKLLRERERLRTGYEGSESRLRCRNEVLDIMAWLWAALCASAGSRTDPPYDAVRASEATGQEDNRRPHRGGFVQVLDVRQHMQDSLWGKVI